MIEISWYGWELWGWWMLGGLFIILELFIGASFWLLALGASAIFTGTLTKLWEASLGKQWLFFGAGSVLCSIGLQTYLHFKKKEGLPFPDRFQELLHQEGQIFSVSSDGLMQIELQGSFWRATCSQHQLKTGMRVRVIALDPTRMCVVVEPLSL